MIRKRALVSLVAAPVTLALGYVAGRLVGSAGGGRPALLLLLTGASVSIALIYGVRSEVSRRSRIQQGWLFVVLLGSFVVGYIGLSVLVMESVLDDALSQAERLDTVRAVGLVCLLLWSGVVIGSQAKRVGYRGGDVFMLLIPLYGPLCFLPKMLWRIAGLPHRPWDKKHLPQVDQEHEPEELVPPLPAGLPHRPWDKKHLPQVDQEHEPEELVPPLPAASPPLPPLPLSTPLTRDDKVTSTGGTKADALTASSAFTVSARRWWERHPMAILLIAVGLAIMTSATVLAVGHGAEGASGQPDNSQIGATPPGSLSPAIDNVCSSALDELRSARSDVEEVLRNAVRTFHRAKSRDGKADALRVGTAKLYVIEVRMQSIDPVPQELRTAYGLLGAAVSQLQYGLEQLSISWEGGTADPSAESSYQRGQEALGAARAELYPGPC